MQSENPDGNPYANGFEYGVRHLLSRRSGLVSDVLLSSGEVSEQEFNELLKLGSIYLSGQRVLADQAVEVGTYIRVHTRPRRFPKNEFNWQERILFQNEDFMVVNKPAGLPVHASVDNIQENLQVYLSNFLQLPLLVTHRLDVPTKGLLVFAKNKLFLAEFNRLLSERSIQKIYQAKVEGALLPVGEYKHFMEPSPRAPKKVSETAEPGWQECRLRILSSRCASENAEQEVRIELLTGRTHQIRAQLSAMGNPILGDTMYGAKKHFAGEEIELTAIQLEFLNHQFKLA